MSVVEARSGEAVGQEIEIRGWVRTRRDSKGGFSFIEVNDGSCLSNLQIVADAALENYQTEITSLSVGSSIVAQGVLQASQGQGQATELAATSVRLLGDAPSDFPLQKKRHSFEKLREWAHLRPRTNAFGAVARVRNCLAYSIHQFFQEERFYYVNTPIITASDCEGAGQMFRVTTLPLDQVPLKDGKVDFAKDFFGKASYLTVSGQLEGEIYATSLGRCYTFGPTFRAENSHTSRHLSEFWMIEPEAAFFDLSDNMALAERFIKRLLTDVLSKCAEDMKFFDERIQPGVLAALTTVKEKPFQHMSYTEAVDILKNSGEKFEYAIDWGADLQAEHERYLTEKHVQGPLILHDYPKSIKPFYMRCNEDDRTVAAMDVLVPQVGEIIGGSQREERLDILLERMQQLGLSQEEYWWYVDLRKYGSVPHSGFGLGFERLVQWVTGMTNIRDCIPFPRTPGSAEF
ncbi:asparagine--tRNA ligase [Aureliella helgolandensis]|uniref:Asparagine--tRNA ligase n=1 Tax=Aureliella helgolandensis TaxID=2527968 RepID=A0A518G5P6_9BACT|nr:asparagine--tRNA ligase [Aureliella helgolandensis]QDV23912.1 Asparagine--tRNA ligase [Aureliella helgolandensis]